MSCTLSSRIHYTASLWRSVLWRHQMVGMSVIWMHVCEDRLAAWVQLLQHDEHLPARHSL